MSVYHLYSPKQDESINVFTKNNMGDLLFYPEYKLKVETTYYIYFGFLSVDSNCCFSNIYYMASYSSFISASRILGIGFKEDTYFFYLSLQMVQKHKLLSYLFTSKISLLKLSYRVHLGLFQMSDLNKSYFQFY